MKSFLLLLATMFSFAFTQAQNDPVTDLPVGRYETILKDGAGKWVKGDIIILDENHYKITSSNETGVYKFSSTAQRLFFTSGPLKSIFAKTTLSNNRPAIFIPAAENQDITAADVWGYYKQ